MENLEIMLRSLSADDAPGIAEAMSSGEVQKWLLGVPYPYSENDAVEFIESVKDSNQDFAVAKANNDKLVGVISFMTSRYPDLGDLEIGYWIAPEYWGWGIGTKVVAQMLKIAQLRGISELIASTKLDNIRSQHVLLKNGFRPVGEREANHEITGQSYPLLILKWSKY